MPRRKKQARELTKDEAMKKMFPKKVRDEAYKIAHEKDDKGKPASSWEKCITDMAPCQLDNPRSVIPCSPTC